MKGIEHLWPVYMDHPPHGVMNLGKEKVLEEVELATSLPVAVAKIIKDYYGIDMEMFFESFYDFPLLIEKKNEIIFSLSRPFLNNFCLGEKWVSGQLSTVDKENIWKWLNDGFEILHVFKNCQQEQMQETKRWVLEMYDTYAPLYVASNRLQEKELEEELSSFIFRKIHHREEIHNNVVRLVDLTFYACMSDETDPRNLQMLSDFKLVIKKWFALLIDDFFSKFGADTISRNQLFCTLVSGIINPDMVNSLGDPMIKADINTGFAFKDFLRTVKARLSPSVAALLFLLDCLFKGQ